VQQGSRDALRDKHLAAVRNDAQSYQSLWPCRVARGVDSRRAELAKRIRRLNGLFASSMSHPAERLAARTFEHAKTLLERQRKRVARNEAWSRSSLNHSHAVVAAS